MTIDDERQLIKLLNNPKTQRSAFEKIVRTYSEQLYWQIRRLVLVHDDANDILQNVFLKAWMHLDDFHQGSRLSTWLYRIAINESIDFIRKKKNQLCVSTDEEDQSVANQLLADNYFDGDETQALLQEAVSQLPDVQRTVFSLRYYEDMKYSEISQILKTSEGALKASYHIAVKKISDFFQRHD